MKQLTTKMFVLFFGVALLCSSCSKNQPAIPDELQVSFQNMFPAVEFNKDIQVRLRDMSGETPLSGSEVEVCVINTSNESIFLSSDPKQPFIRVYMIRDDIWVELKNNVEYFSSTGGDGSIFEPVGDQQMNYFFTAIRPVLEPAAGNANDEEIIRVFVIGERMIDEKRSGVFTGAFVDLFIKRD